MFISSLRRSFRSLAPIFSPPFDGLWVAVLLYFFWCFLVHPKAQLLRGNLPDPDDYMYLDQVLDWLKGQSWYDNLQHRLDPPQGGIIHFSRLPQLLMAAFILFFHFLGLPLTGAATITAILEPLFLFAGLLFALRWLAQNFMPREWTGVTAYVALFATGLIAMFTPGHLDHHGLILLLEALALGCIMRMLQEPEKLMWGCGAGLILAFALTIALEVLPWLILITGWIGLWAIMKGRGAARSGLAYGLTLYLVCALLLLVTKRPSAFFVPDVAAYSIVYVYFTGGIAAVFAAIALAANVHMLWRWVAGGGVAAVSGALFLSHFPALLGGPWGGVDPALAKLILENVNEAAPLLKIKGSWLKTLAGISESLIALGSCVYFLRQTRRDQIWGWGLLALLLAAGILLAVFYQYRFVGGLGLFSVVPLAVLLQRGWSSIGHHCRARQKVFAEIGLLLLVGPLPGVLLPALFDGRSFNTGILLFPVHTSAASVCDMYELEKVLHAHQLYAGKSRLIMNTMGLGPELLFRTPHKVMSAPYHEVVKGNLDAVRFFSATDPAKAEAIVRQRGVELVVACKLVPGMYSNLAAVKEALPDAFAGDDKPDAKLSPPMILRLITEQQLPDWLVPVHSPSLVNYVVYEITPLAREKKSETRG